MTNFEEIRLFFITQFSSFTSNNGFHP